MENSLLIRFICGQCSEQEKEEVINALLQDESLQKEFIALKNVWSLAETVDPAKIDFSDEYQSISRKISRNRLKTILRYAAVIVTIFGCGSILAYLEVKNNYTPYISSNKGIETRFVIPSGQTGEIQLPDGTVVWMNSGTVLSYSPDFSPTNRSIRLEGEAFFSVKHDSIHPFVVKTTSVNIKVLGTSFNVEAYNDSLHQTNTTLVSGKVEIQDLKNQKLAQLVPGQIARFSKQKGEIKIATVDTSFYTCWKNGYIMFNNSPLEEIIQKMERWYNVKFVIQNPKIKNLRYSGTILRGKPIDQILEIMKITANIKYTIAIRSKSANIIYLN